MGELPKREMLDIIKNHLVNEGYQRTRRGIEGWHNREWVWSKRTGGKRGEGLSSEDQMNMLDFLSQPAY